MANSQRVKVNEERRMIVFDNGERLNLHNVVEFDPSGTQLRLWSDEGMAIVNPDRVLYHLIGNKKYDQKEPSNE